MSNLSQNTIQRFIDMGENNISVERPFLIDRISIPVVAGNATYILPDYVVSIKRATFLGVKLSPLSFRQQRENFYTSVIGGKPFWYVYNNMGQNTVKLFPIPQTSVPKVTHVWDTDIPNGCIIEYYRTPGTLISAPELNGLWGSTLWGGGTGTDVLIFELPAYIRRQLIKQFVAVKTFEVEGANQNQKLCGYFVSRWNKKKAEFISLINELHNKPRKIMVSGTPGSRMFPGTPILPIDRFGQSVEEGY